jgi:hypothetical protein
MVYSVDSVMWRVCLRGAVNESLLKAALVASLCFTNGDVCAEFGDWDEDHGCILGCFVRKCVCEDGTARKSVLFFALPPFSISLSDSYT